VLVELDLPTLRKERRGGALDEAARCTAARCGAVRRGAVRCGAVRCGTVRCGARLLQQLLLASRGGVAPQPIEHRQVCALRRLTARLACDCLGHILTRRE
jgi:hypothetical protein